MQPLAMLIECITTDSGSYVIVFWTIKGPAENCWRSNLIIVQSCKSGEEKDFSKEDTLLCDKLCKHVAHSSACIFTVSFLVWFVGFTYFVVEHMSLHQDICPYVSTSPTYSSVIYLDRRH